MSEGLTIECSVMSGCGQGHELVKDMWKKLWLKFTELTHSRSGNTGEKSATSLNKTSRKYNSGLTVLQAKRVPFRKFASGYNHFTMSKYEL